MDLNLKYCHNGPSARENSTVSNASLTLYILVGVTDNLNAGQTVWLHRQQML